MARDWAYFCYARGNVPSSLVGTHRLSAAPARRPAWARKIQRRPVHGADVETFGTGGD